MASMKPSKKRLVPEKRVVKMISQENVKEILPAPAVVQEVLTEAEKFFVEAKVKEGATLETLVKALSKSEKTIQDYINTLSKKVISQFEKNLEKQTVSKRKVGTTVMTMGASQAGDEASKQNKADSNNIKYKDCITTIRDVD